jgi:surface antigen/LysM repeat protein
MSPFLNTRARLARAARNNVKVYSASDTFRKFRWFTVFLVVLLPIYPSLSVLWSDMSLAHASDYDESTIITAYSDIGPDSPYISENGLVSLDYDSPVFSEEQNPTVPEASLTTVEGSEQKEAQKRAPVIVQYTIQNGDTLAKLSDRYDVSIEAITWANDLSSKDILKPGSIIKIPPMSGVIHKVSKGDTLSEIAARYQISQQDITRVNRLSDTASLRIGAELVIPGAVKKWDTATPKTVAPIVKAPSVPKPVPAIQTNVSGLKDRYAVKYTGNSRGFVAGNCTWYVAQNKTVTWRGNANQWLKNAKAAGVKTGKTPVPGAIVQLSGRGYNRYYGHVGIVADVTEDHVIVKDMNYRGLYEVTIRKIPRDDVTIDGYIYVD